MEILAIIFKNLTTIQTLVTKQDTCVLKSLLIKLLSMAEIKIMHRNETSYNNSKRITPARCQPQSLSLLHKKKITRELSSANSQIKSIK